MKAFEVKVKYEKMMEDGTNKIVSEVYLTDAMSFCEAEAIICKEMPMLTSLGKCDSTPKDPDSADNTDSENKKEAVVESTLVSGYKSGVNLGKLLLEGK